MVKSELNGQGKILDIGTGSGSLIIKLAIAFPESFLTGIDYWGELGIFTGAMPTEC